MLIVFYRVYILLVFVMYFTRIWVICGSSKFYLNLRQSAFFKMSKLMCLWICDWYIAINLKLFIFCSGGSEKPKKKNKMRNKARQALQWVCNPLQVSQRGGLISFARYGGANTTTICASDCRDRTGTFLNHSQDLWHLWDLLFFKT